MKIIVLLTGILIFQVLIWFLVFSWIKKKNRNLAQKMETRTRASNERVVIGPTSALFRGSDAKFGNVKGNGVICLTDHSVFFEKLTGQEIKVSRAEITDATVEQWFKGKPSFATGGKHLVIKTTDGNRIGFLLRDAELWADKLRLGH